MDICRNPGYSKIVEELRWFRNPDSIYSNSQIYSVLQWPQRRLTLCFSLGDRAQGRPRHWYFEPVSGIHQSWALGLLGQWFFMAQSEEQPRFLVGGWATLWKIYELVIWDCLFAVYGKIKHLPNHQPVVGIWTFMRFGDFASSVGIYLDPKTGFVVDRTRGVTKKQPFHWSHQLHRVRITVDLLLELPESNAKCAELWYLPTNGGGNWRVFWIPNYGDIDHKKIH